MRILGRSKKRSTAEMKAKGDVDGLKRKLLGEGEEDRFEAATALAEIGGVNGVDALLAACIHQDVSARIAGAAALGQVKDPAAAPRLIQIVEAGELPVAVRSLACMSLGGIGDQRAREPLISALDDPDVRDSAASALGGVGGEEAADALLARYEAGEIGFPALLALATAGDKRSLPLARDYLVQTEGEKGGISVDVAVDAIGGDEAAAKELREGKTTGADRDQLVHAIVAIGGDEAAAVLVDAPLALKSYLGTKWGERSGREDVDALLASIEDEGLRNGFKEAVDRAGS